MDALATLLAHPGAPGLVHLHHPHHPASSIQPVLPSRCVVVRLDAIEHHTQRLFYGGTLNRLTSALDQEKNDVREMSSWDMFARALRGMWSTRTGKGKGKAGALEDEGQIVLLVTKAERLRSVLGAEWSALTRLSELTDVPATVVLCSQMPWDDLRPLRGDAPEPIHVYLEPLRREVISQLASGSEHPLYSRFIDLLLATIGHLTPTSPPSEIDYVAGALWPLYTATLPAHAEQTLLGRPYDDPENPPPPLAITVKLLTELKTQLSLALAAAAESVLPRVAGRNEFTRGLMPITEDEQVRPVSIRRVPQPPPLDLPLAARFLLIAAYCASYNPATSDMRLFGRGTGVDGKRRRGGGMRRAGYGRVRTGKVPQRLLGPKAFPIDRLLAMFSSLYAEHAPRPEDLESDDESDTDAHKYITAAEAAVKAQRRRDIEIERDERWEDEVDHLAFSTKLWAMIPELEGRGLLHRMSPVDRLDNIMLRSDIDYETAKNLAKDLKITLDEYLYELTT